MPLWEGSLDFPVLPEAYVVYDPFDIDMKHVDLLAAEFAFTHVPLPNAGHTVTGYLLETDLLQPLVLAVCRGAFEPAPFVAEARLRRRRSPQYFSTLAERTALSNPRRRTALLEQAVRIAPGHAGCRRRLAGEYARVGRFDEAIAMHRKSLAVEPGHPDLMWHFSVTLEASGDLAGALAQMEAIDSAPAVRRSIVRGCWNCAPAWRRLTHPPIRPPICRRPRCRSRNRWA